MLLKNGFPNGKSDWLLAMGLSCREAQGLRELGWLVRAWVNLPEARDFIDVFILI